MNTCFSPLDAKKNCPIRWTSLMKWFDQIKKIITEARPAIKNLFYDEGVKKTTPECLVKLVPEFDPTAGKNN